MDIKQLMAIVNTEDAKGLMKDKKYWEQLFKLYCDDRSEDFANLPVKDALVRIISDINYMNRCKYNNCGELSIDLHIGDICYIDFGCAYVNEIGFQHFGLVLNLFHNKAYVVPMSGNQKAFEEAYSKSNPNGKKHLMRLGMMEGMNKKSVLFINDSKWINSARIIDVKAHLDVNSELFKEIKERVKKCLD